MISVVDYGLGNLHSIKKALNYIGHDVLITNDKGVIKSSKKIILPGVGHFSRGIKNLEKFNLVETLREKSLSSDCHILGICLGMQLLTNFSEEGNIEGLKIVDLNVSRFNLEEEYKIPHIGWNSIKAKESISILEGIGQDELFYFVHSYAISKSGNSKIKYGFTDYGKSFVSIFSKDNVFGVQFHPEKSHNQGLKILENFVNL